MGEPMQPPYGVAGDNPWPARGSSNPAGSVRQPGPPSLLDERPLKQQLDGRRDPQDQPPPQQRQAPPLPPRYRPPKVPGGRGREHIGSMAHPADAGTQPRGRK
jgi:hypothetical protein